MRPYLPKIGAFAKRILHMERFHWERGRILALWAGIENSIDVANNHAWEYSDRTISKVVPINLRWKLELFERIHTKLLPYVPLRTQAKELVKLINERKDDRHWLAHGVTSYISSKDGKWKLTRAVAQDDGGMKFEDRYLTDSDLKAIRKDLFNLSARIARYAYSLSIEMRKHDEAKASR